MSGVFNSGIYMLVDSTYNNNAGNWTRLRKEYCFTPEEELIFQER